MRDWLIVDPAFQQRFRESNLDSTGAVLRHFCAETAGRKRTAVTSSTIRFADGSSEQVFLKQYVFPSPAWSFVGRRSKARREFENYGVFRSLNIPCPLAIACGELRDGLGRLRRAFILTRAVPDARNLIEFVQARCPNRGNAAARQLRRGIIARLAPMVARIHVEGFFHNDLVWRNVLVVAGTGGTPELWWIDCPRGRFARLGRGRLRVKDLALLDRAAAELCSRGERLAFVKAYLGKTGLDPQTKEFARSVLAYKRRRWRH
jgi:tRNA A-37 threonylcarbamoyl transferase component Bud32